MGVARQRGTADKFLVPEPQIVLLDSGGAGAVAYRYAVEGWGVGELGHATGPVAHAFPSRQRRLAPRRGGPQGGRAPLGSR